MIHEAKPNSVLCIWHTCKILKKKKANKIFPSRQCISSKWKETKGIRNGSVACGRTIFDFGINVKARIMYTYMHTHIPNLFWDTGELSIKISGRVKDTRDESGKDRKKKKTTTFPFDICHFVSCSWENEKLRSLPQSFQNLETKIGLQDLLKKKIWHIIQAARWNFYWAALWKPGRNRLD